MKMVECIVDGEIMSFKDACIKLGLNRENVKSYAIRNNLSYQEVLDDCIKLTHNHDASWFELNGKVYTTYSRFSNHMTIIELAKEIGVNYSTLTSAIRRYCTVQEAVNFANAESESFKLNKRDSVIVDGKSVSIREACRLLGVPSHTVYSYIKREGVSGKEAIDKCYTLSKVNISCNTKLCIGGIIYNSVSDAARSVYWSYTSAYMIAKRVGKSIEDVIKERYEKIVSGNMTGHDLRIKHDVLEEIVFAFKSRSGQNYFYCTCKECKTKMLLSCRQVLDFKHDNSFCIEHEMEYDMRTEEYLRLKR